MKELDVLLERYMENRYDAAPESERAAFEHLLDMQDPELYLYLTGRIEAPEPRVRDIVERIVNTARS